MSSHQISTAKFVVVAKFLNEQEAHIVKADLAAGGVESMVDGANTNAMLSHIGSALGGVRLLVAEADKKRAEEILGTYEKQKAQGNSTQGQSTWFCGTCREVLDVSFETCWSCGNERSEVEQAMPSDLENHPDLAEQVVSAEDDPTSRADDLAQRAWRASLFSFAVLPFIFNFYSIALIFQVCACESELSQSGKRKFYGAILANLLFGFMMWTILKVGF